MAKIEAGYARCYSSSSTSYGYYKVEVEYSGSSRSGKTITVTGVKIIATRQGSGYTTNPIACNASCGNQSFSGANVNSSGSASPASWSKDLGTCTFTNVAAGTSSVGCSVWFGATNTGTPVNNTVYIPCPTAGNPSYNSITVSNLGRTSATLTTSANAGSNASLVTVGHDVGLSTSSFSWYNSNPTNLTGLTPNTLYYYRGYIVNSADIGLNSGWNSFTTTGNAPTINSVSSSASRTSATISYNVSYDTNSSFSSLSINYGTTTSYGNTSSSANLSGLTPNTKYYYSLTIKENHNRTSAAKTGSFTTSGNNPIINSVSDIPSRNGCALDCNVSYDTNANYSSININYGTTTSYGSNSTSNQLSGLNPNTNYYYSITIKDNWERTSAAKTGSFLTTANQPTFTTESIENVGINDAILKFVAVADTNVNITKYSLYNDLNVKISENTTGIFNIIDLESEMLYSYYCIVTDSASRTKQSSTLIFETLAPKFIHYMNNDNIDKLIKLSAIGDLKNYINHMNLEVGGIDFQIGRSYTLACNNSTSTTSMRSNLISIADTSLKNNNSCFIQSTLYSWKIQHYDSSGNGLNQITGNIGEAAIINFTDMNGYIAIEIGSIDENKIKSSTKIYSCNSDDLTNILNNNKKIIKTITPSDLVKVSKYMRYIDIGASGSNINNYSHIGELEVYDKDGVNRALGIIPTLIKGDNISDAINSTDGNINTYTSMTGVNTIARFDLGSVYEINSVKLWRYYSDNRKYYKTFVYGRAGERQIDGLQDKELCYKFHDYKRDGIYQETSAGKIWNVNKKPFDNDKPIINSFTANTISWTNQGVTLTILAEDNMGTENLIYSFDGGLNWTKKNAINVFKNKTYTAIVKDKQGNISETNPTIVVNNVDLVAPSMPVIIMRYDDINGDEYNGDIWTNKDIYVDCKEGISYNLCHNIIEYGYINKDTGLDISDRNKIREVNKMLLTSGDILYVQRYNDNNLPSGTITIYFYDNSDNYLGYKDVDLSNPFITIIENSNYCRIADTSNDLNNYYLVTESDIPRPYIIYYNVTDNLSGIKGWYYRTSLSSDTYVRLIVNNVINTNINNDLYIVTRDNANNNSKHIIKTLKIDKEPPRDVRFSFTKSSNSLNIIASAIDDLSGIRGYKFSIDGGNTWTEEQENNEYTFNDLDGIYDVMVRVYDLANNYTNSEYQVIAIGDTSLFPSVSSVNGNPVNWTNQNVTLSVNGVVGPQALSGTTISKYSFNNGQTWQNSNNKTFENNCLVYIRVEDSEGNKSDTYVVEINKIDKILPTLNLPIETLQVPVGTSVDLWSGVSYYDNDSGIDESKTTVIPNDTSTLLIGEQNLQYSITDNANNTTIGIRLVNVIGSVPADTLYPSGTLYPDNLKLPNSELAQYTYEELNEYKLKDIRGGSI